eukprot:TRINITY_DN160_c9_g1_i1.p1 TRINITY_DN160_c9_g1~~TRINITY_DN160_c9_g1_i1.p1  ORF type:complete len:259 (+),score=49.53 TRINITY_DN160_c9_g1_i1:57-833(+)
MNGRKDVQAFGAAVVKLPNMASEEKRFVVLQKDLTNQHKMRLEFYVGATAKEAVDTFELGTDFKVTVSEETKSIQYNTTDKRTCTMTFFKAPCTADTSRTMGSFLTPIQFIGTLTKGSVPPLDTSVSTTDATLQEQIAGKKTPAASSTSRAAKPTAPASGGTRISGPSDDTSIGLFETVSESGGIKTIHYTNNTPSLLFVVSLTLKNAESIKTLNKNIKVTDSTYELTISPGQGGNYISGKWKGQSKSISKKIAKARK